MIRFDHVTKTFSTGVTALDDAVLEIGDGELVVISGPSGSGKTTILRLLLKEIDPTSGSLSLDDMKIETLKPKDLPSLRRSIGAVFQDFKILEDRTVKENIGLVLEILGESDATIESRTHDVLDLVGLAGKEQMFPRQLSGGELQRVAIARALAPRPRVLFADEPTGNLDPKTSEGIALLLKTINKEGTTVIVASHDQTVIDVLDARMLKLEEGRIRETEKES